MIGALDEAAVSRVAAHYDELDELYRDVWGLHVHHGLWLTGDESDSEATENLVRLLCLRARIPRGSSVVDVGCGYGETARMLVRERDARVTALTISERQRAWCGETENPRFLLRDWLSKPLEASSHDVVIAIESTEHMPDARAFYEEAARVLRPGGSVAVCAWLHAGGVHPFLQDKLLSPICRDGHLVLRTRHEHERAIHLAGLRVRSFDDLSARVSRTFIHPLPHARARGPPHRSPLPRSVARAARSARLRQGPRAPPRRVRPRRHALRPLRRHALNPAHASTGSVDAR